VLSSDLKIGKTFAIFNLEGNVPRSIDLLNPYDLLLDNLTLFGDIGQKKNEVAGDLFLPRNSVKSFFGVGRLLAKVVKCSFIIFEIRDFMLTVVLLFGCLKQLIFIDVFFLRFKRVFIPSKFFAYFLSYW